jgi:uncharacterized protein YjdB/predicted amino acid-binding ACT domain protein
MEFTGSIQFADESSWLTLTTESDDTVTITVKFGSRILASQEVLSFDVAPNSGIVRLPAGEILGALMGNGIGMVTGSFTATQGSSSCSYSFSVLPCRKFAYKSLAATIFTTRPTKSPAYEGAEDRLYFYRTSGDVSTYVRFDYLDGGSSTSYKLSPTYYVSTKYYDLDISTGTMLSTAASKGLDTSKITGFKIWIEYSGSKSETYSFEIRRTRLPLKTYKFLGRRGTYEYIHATGKFSRSIESETQVFVNSGIEQELENDYSMTFEQNSGHIDSIGMNGYWLEFLAAKERYIIEKDGSERAIVVDEFKTSLTDRTVSSMTFKWHYANPNNTVIDKVDIDITGLGILGPSTVNDVSNTAQFQVTYSPSNTTQRSITWSVVSGSDYASIDEKGLLTVKGGANGSTVKIRATSKDNSSVYAEKSVTVTYKIASVSVTGVSLSKSVLSLAVGESETLVATVAPERATDRSVTWESSNKNVATVNQNGTVKAVAAGSAVIGVRTNDGGFTARCNLTVAAVVNEYTLTVNCATPGAIVKVLEYVAGQSSIADAVTYTEPMTFRENTTVKVWAYKNGMIDSGMQTIVMDSNKTATVACKTIPTWNLESEMSAEAAGLSIPYEVSDPDSVGWRLESDADWIAVDSDVVIDVNTNSSSSSRTGHVKLICDTVETDYVVATCTVMQAAGAATELDPSISLLQDTFSVPATTTSVTQLFSSKNLTGLTATVTGALEGATVNLNEVSKTIVVNFRANTTSSERVSTVTVTGTRSDGKGTYSKSFTITQAAAAVTETYLRVTPATINAPADRTQFTNADGTLTIEANQSWTAEVTSGDDWLDIDAVNGTGDGTNGIMLLESNTGSERTGTILFTGADGKTATVTVIQAAGASSELDPSISFLQDTFRVPATTTSVTQFFSSKNLTGLTATVTGALEGATVNLNEVSKTIVVNFRANTAATERTGKVTVTGTRADGQGTYSKSFTIEQSAAKAAATWDLPATLAFEAGGDGVVFNITDKDSAGWRLTLPDWCFVSDGITEGSGDHETDLVARANYTGSARTGHITLYPAGSSTMTMRCEVSQEEDTTIEQG